MKPQGTAMFLLTSIPQPLPVPSGKGNHGASMWQLLLPWKMISFYQKKNSLHQRTKEITDKFTNSSATLPEIPTMFLQLLTTFFQFLFILCHLLPYPRLKGGQSSSFLFSCVKGLDFIVFKVLLCSHLRPSSHNDSYERPRRLKKFLLHTLYAHQSEKRRGWHSRAGVDPAEVQIETLIICSYIP